jgi:hypothetical protein
VTWERISLIPERIWWHRPRSGISSARELDALDGFYDQRGLAETTLEAILPRQDPAGIDALATLERAPAPARDA